MTIVYFIFIIAFLLGFLVIAFFGILAIEKGNEKKHPMYHKKNGKLLTIYMYQMNRSKGGGSYYEYRYIKGQDGKYTKYQDKEKKINIRFWLIFSLMAVVLSIFVLWVKERLILSSFLEMAGILLIGILFVCLIEKQEERKAMRYIKEHNLE